MDSPDYTTEHQKGKHLTCEDYVKIQVRLQDGWSANRIAVKELHCSPNTVRKIIRQGMTLLYHGKVQRFKAKTAWQIHKENRSRCCRTYKAAEKKAFLSYVESHFCRDDKWSLDACVGYALAHNLFKRSEMLCTKTLYNRRVSIIVSWAISASLAAFWRAAPARSMDSSRAVLAAAVWR